MTKIVNVLRPASHKSFRGNRYWKDFFFFFFKKGAYYCRKFFLSKLDFHILKLETLQHN